MTYYFNTARIQKEQNSQTVMYLQLKLKINTLKKLIQAKNIIESNTGAPIHIATLSRKLGLNKQVLKKFFKIAYGTTIYAYQINIRMEKACQLLLKSKVSIDEIAAEAGYKNTSSFIGMFSKIFWNNSFTIS